MVKDLNLKARDFLFILAIMWLVVFNVRQCSTNNLIHKNLRINTDTAMYYKSKNGDLVSYNNAIKIELEDLKMYNVSLKNELNNLKIKKPESITRVVSIIKTDTIPYYFRDTLPCDDFVEDIVIDSAFYDISMTLTKDSIVINNISFPNEQIVTIGVKKNGLFKRNEYVFVSKNSNPHILTTAIESYSIKEKRRFLENPILHEVIGAGIMFTIMTFAK